MTTKIFTTAFLTLFVVLCNSQNKFELPKTIVLETEQDYKKYEGDIIKAAKWLEETDLDKETNKRKEINDFLMKWIMGTSAVTVEIKEPLINLCGENENLLALFAASYSRNFLENKKSATKFTATRAGITSMINVYKKGIAVTKSTELEKAIKLYDQGKLDQYIKSKAFKTAERRITERC